MGIILPEFAWFFTKSGGRMGRPTALEALDMTAAPGAKAACVREMFDAIAPRYDLLNSLLSAGVHHGWRRFATRCAAVTAGDCVLDLCTGTGDWAVELRKAVGKDGRVVGADFAFRMLAHGAEKFAGAAVPCCQADAVHLPFATGAFDAVTVAFGIRNIAELDHAFAEMARVTRSGGRVVCLEFARPGPGPFRVAYDAYSRWVMPKVGGAISGRPDAYAYLPESMIRFKGRAELARMMREAGLAHIRQIDLTFGLVCVHVGTKP
jgi:demethylmenaquinone methyltransferase/2-methoxy-6-polyprenyl-1,4-benzoquinol methylase